MQISLNNVNKTFYSISDYTEVLKDINLKVDKGEIIAIVGPSGCGKSTILNLISGLISPDSGNIIVDGKIGYTFLHSNKLSF